MKIDVNWLVEPLSNHHDRKNFDCSVDSLNAYLKKQATQDVKRKITRVFVATRLEAPSIIQGFYTLSSLSIQFNQLPQMLAKKLPKHPIPAALLGRLACDVSAQGLGLGRMLLADAIKRVLSVSREMGIYALVVDALNDAVEKFYEQFGFQQMGEYPNRLFLPLRPL